MCKVMLRKKPCSKSFRKARKACHWHSKRVDENHGVFVAVHTGGAGADWGIDTGCRGLSSASSCDAS